MKLKLFEEFQHSNIDPYGEENWDDDKSIVVGNLMVSPDLGQHSWYEAVEICKNYRGEGFNDWRLPTKDELNEIYKYSKEFGNFEIDWHWTSSEFNYFYAWCQNFYNGNQGNHFPKDNYGRVRSVRNY
jgi:hypothetical protein